jgi:hypothetical protein
LGVKRKNLLAERKTAPGWRKKQEIESIKRKE